MASKLRNEYVVSIKGRLRLRKDPNPKLPTGLLELLAEDIQVGGRRGAGCWGKGGSAAAGRLDRQCWG